MNRTKIEWCDYTWSPVTGCKHGCEYCYAKRIDQRFNDGRFEPTFHPKRLEEPLKVKKPSRIFVGSMADLFGDWDWDDGFGWLEREYVVNEVFNIVNQCPQHTFIFLTKNPKGMQGFNFPDNCWCGTSVENQEKANERIPELLRVKCKTLFVSYEPALESIDFKNIVADPPHDVTTMFGGEVTYSIVVDALCGKLSCNGIGGVIKKDYKKLSWLIIGAQTGPGAVKPDSTWIKQAIGQARNANVPVFVKDNVRWHEQIREYPREG
jgi:protein gp37